MPEVQTPPASPSAAAPPPAAGTAPAPAGSPAAPSTPTGAPAAPAPAPGGAARRVPIYVWIGGLVLIQAGLSFLILSRKVAPQLAQTAAPVVVTETHSAPRPEPPPPPPAQEDLATREVGPLEVLEPMVMNLIPADGKGSSFVKIGVALELAPQTKVEAFADRLPIVRDAIIRVMSTKTETDVADAAGKETLRREMLSCLQSVLGSTTVRNVYYTHFVVQ